MPISKAEVKLNCDIKRVWKVITDNSDYKWRSDIEKIKITSDNTFVEYTKDGFKTVFKITKFEPYSLYEFDMENDNMSGHWLGEFIGDENEMTLILTEDVNAKKMIMKPFVKSYLKKQQGLYIKDLKSVLDS